MERWITGGRLVGESPGAPSALRIVDGRIAGRALSPPASALILDVGGHWLCPMAIDAHVHLVYQAGLAAPAPAPGGPDAPARAPDDPRPGLRTLALAMLRGGICAALDLGAPLGLLAALRDLSPLRVLASGPLLCAPGGYPTQSWGARGFGLALSTPAEAREAVARLVDHGAAMVKLSLDGRFPVLDPEVARAAAEEGHARGLHVCAHALDVAATQAALAAGADVLAHTPVEPLPDALVREAGARAVTVLSTLQAFGGTDALVDNLARLHAAGARVLYGTDLGNQDTAPGLLAPELDLLACAGLSPERILAAATRDVAAFLDLRDHGTLEDGALANLLVLPGDPLLDATVLARPAFVLVAGERLAH